MQARLKQEFENRLFMYPSDAHYIRAIVQEFGLSPKDDYKLFSIMGGQELADTLPLASYRNFQCLKKNDTDYRFNLHLHTYFSDGVLDPLQVLNQAVEIANTNAPHKTLLPPFTVAITDHNDIQALPIVLKELIKNPDKYKNLRVVLGCEFGAVWKDSQTQKRPFAFEMMYYCINPFDKNIIRYMKEHLDIRRHVTDLIFDQLHNAFPDAQLSEQEAFKQDPVLEQNNKYGIPGGILAYAKQKITDENAHAYLHDLCYRYHNAFDVSKEEDPYQPYTDLFELQRRSGFGFLGVAHPQRMNVGNFLSDAYIQQCNAMGKNAGYEMIYTLLNKLKSAGLRALEINYQFDLESFIHAQKMLLGQIAIDETDGNYHWLKLFKDFAERYDLLQAGGYDTHSDDIRGR